MSADLVEWLAAQLDADEQVARDRRTKKPGNPAHRVGNLSGEGYVHVEVEASPAITMTWEEYREEFTVPAEPDRRVLTDIAAKRAILGELEKMPHALDDGHHECPMVEPRMWRDPRCTCGRDAFVDRMRCHLATVYAERDGYRDEWGPA